MKSLHLFHFTMIWSKWILSFTNDNATHSLFNSESWRARKQKSLIHLLQMIKIWYAWQTIWTENRKSYIKMQSIHKTRNDPVYFGLFSVVSTKPEIKTPKDNRRGIKAWRRARTSFECKWLVIDRTETLMAIAFKIYLFAILANYFSFWISLSVTIFFPWFSSSDFRVVCTFQLLSSAFPFFSPCFARSVSWVGFDLIWNQWMNCL